MATVALGAHVIEVRPRERGRTGTQEWDAFARRCEASFRGSTAHLRAWSLKRFPRVRLRLFEIFRGDDDGRYKIGQCAVAVHAEGGHFLDRLVLEREHLDSWRSAMAAVLEHLDEGTYTYGWEQNLEPPRQDELATVTGVSVCAVRPLTVHSLEFGSWPSWDEYHSAVSTNVKRNVKKALAEFPDLIVERRSGRAALRHLRPLMRLRADMYSRKGLRFREPVTAISTAANLLSGGHHTFTALANGGGRTLAAFRGIRFASNTYYLDGGSTADNKGASWYLLMEVIHEAYSYDPKGRFVMGYLDERLHDESVSGGLLRQRRSCRVTDVSTSTVTFAWMGSKGSDR